MQQETLLRILMLMAVAISWSLAMVMPFQDFLLNWLYAKVVFNDNIYPIAAIVF